jgi:exodeoxyribonuclease VII large subunit
MATSVNNNYGLQFHVTLFPAVMQGEQVEQSVIAALNSIYSDSRTCPATASAGFPMPPFDCVVIIRGGGATADLSGFDTLALAENVAQFPLPVITGIGHDRDESILDMVAHTRVKTPTAAAAFLIDNLKRVLDRLTDAQQHMSVAVTRNIAARKTQVANLSTLIPTLAMRTLNNGRHRIELIENQLPAAIERRLTDHKHRLERLTLLLQGFDPQLLLSRGYSITLHNGRSVRDSSLLQPGDEIETRVEKGSFKAIVK